MKVTVVVTLYQGVVDDPVLFIEEEKAEKHIKGMIEEAFEKKFRSFKAAWDYYQDMMDNHACDDYEYHIYPNMRIGGCTNAKK